MENGSNNDEATLTDGSASGGRDTLLYACGWTLLSLTLIVALVIMRMIWRIHKEGEEEEIDFTDSGNSSRSSSDLSSPDGVQTLLSRSRNAKQIPLYPPHRAGVSPPGSPRKAPLWPERVGLTGSSNRIQAFFVRLASSSLSGGSSVRKGEGEESLQSSTKKSDSDEMMDAELELIPNYLPLCVRHERPQKRVAAYAAKSNKSRKHSRLQQQVTSTCDVLSGTPSDNEEIRSVLPEGQREAETNADLDSITPREKLLAEPVGENKGASHFVFLKPSRWRDWRPLFTKIAQNVGPWRTSLLQSLEPRNSQPVQFNPSKAAGSLMNAAADDRDIESGGQSWREMSSQLAMERLKFFESQSAKTIPVGLVKQRLEEISHFLPMELAAQTDDEECQDASGQTRHKVEESSADHPSAEPENTDQFGDAPTTVSRIQEDAPASVSPVVEPTKHRSKSLACPEQNQTHQLSTESTENPAKSAVVGENVPAIQNHPLAQPANVDQTGAIATPDASTQENGIVSPSLSVEPEKDPASSEQLKSTKEGDSCELAHPDELSPVGESVPAAKDIYEGPAPRKTVRNPSAKAKSKSSPPTETVGVTPRSRKRPPAEKAPKERTRDGPSDQQRARSKTKKEASRNRDRKAVSTPAKSKNMDSAFPRTVSVRSLSSVSDIGMGRAKVVRRQSRSEEERRRGRSKTAAKNRKSSESRSKRSDVLEKRSAHKRKRSVKKKKKETASNSQMSVLAVTETVPPLVILEASCFKDDMSAVTEVVYDGTDRSSPDPRSEVGTKSEKTGHSTCKTDMAAGDLTLASTKAGTRKSEKTGHSTCKTDATAGDLTRVSVAELRSEAVADQPVDRKVLKSAFAKSFAKSRYRESQSVPGRPQTPTDAANKKIRSRSSSTRAPPSPYVPFAAILLQQTADRDKFSVSDLSDAASDGSVDAPWMRRGCVKN
jgi:hypothetical protein